MIDSKMLLSGAFGYLYAAKWIAESKNGPAGLWPPFFDCICCAIETSLKGYMVHHGATEGECKNQVGHCLQKAVDGACRLGMTKPDPDILALIKKVAPHHKSRSFIYLSSIDVTSFPDFEPTLSTTSRLLNEIFLQLPDLIPT